MKRKNAFNAGGGGGGGGDLVLVVCLVFELDLVLVGKSDGDGTDFCFFALNSGDDRKLECDLRFLGFAFGLGFFA